MPNGSSDISLNVAAKVVGWSDEGGAKIELLVDVDGHKIGERFEAFVRKVSLGRQPSNFAHLRKIGLRTGGYVLLRKAVFEQNGTMSCKSVDSVIDRTDRSIPFIIRDAAVHILPPPTGSAMVKECLVAFPSPVRTKVSLPQALASVRESLSQACEFGRAGLLLTVEDRDGDIIEVRIGGDEELDADEIIAIFKQECPPEIASEIKKAKTKSTIAPYFVGEVDIDRSSRLSAQRANLAYGDLNAPSWSRVNVVMRALGDSWLVCDASPLAEKVGDAPGLLIDV